MVIWLGFIVSLVLASKVMDFTQPLKAVEQVTTNDKAQRTNQQWKHITMA
jgi:hypothetical protein